MNVRDVRKRLGLSAKNFAKMIGSNTCSVYNWEKGRTNPRDKKIWSRINALVSLFKHIEENPDYLIK